MAKRTEEAIVDELTAARADYHEKAQGMTVVEAEKASANIRSLQQELASVLVAGAEPCPTCGNVPHGIHQPTYYEVGCLVGCTVKDSKGNTYPRRAKGLTRKNAVDNWNEGELFYKTVLG